MGVEGGDDDPAARGDAGAEHVQVGLALVLLDEEVKDGAVVSEVESSLGYPVENVPMQPVHPLRGWAEASSGVVQGNLGHRRAPRRP